MSASRIRFYECSTFCQVSLQCSSRQRPFGNSRALGFPRNLHIFVGSFLSHLAHTARKSSTDRQSHQLKIKSNLDAPPGTRSLPVPRSVLGSESTEFENAFSSQRLEVTTCAQTDISDTYHSVSLGHYKSSMLPMESGALRLALLPRKQLQCDW